MTLKVANHLPYSLVSSNHRKGLKSTSHIFWPICHCHQQGGVISCLLPIGDTSLLVSLSYKTLAQKHQQSVLLSLRPNLGLEDPRGHLMKVLALALTPQALALALREKSWPWPCQDFSPTIQATWLLYVYALLKLTVSHDSLPFLV